VVLVLAFALVFGPWLVRLARSLASERSARIRSQERADVAAHLHDSVLQTLALIQRRASRPATITALIGFQLVASPLLLQTTSLGSVRTALLESTVLHLSPLTINERMLVPGSLGLGLLVMALWTAVALGVGAWRTARVDA
jgi:hypothetical protein